MSRPFGANRNGTFLFRTHDIVNLFWTRVTQNMVLDSCFRRHSCPKQVNDIVWATQKGAVAIRPEGAGHNSLGRSPRSERLFLLPP